MLILSKSYEWLSQTGKFYSNKPDSSMMPV